jgi:hypothetical protein
MSSPSEEQACSCALVAAADAVTQGQALSLSAEEIARDAHAAAEEAYALYQHLAEHAHNDALAVHGSSVGRGSAASFRGGRVKPSHKKHPLAHVGAPHHHHGGGHHHGHLHGFGGDWDGWGGAELLTCPPGFHYEIVDGGYACVPDVTVGHGHGHGHHHGGHGFGFGWGGPYYNYWDWGPYVLGCPAGMHYEQLPDGRLACVQGPLYTAGAPHHGGGGGGGGGHHGGGGHLHDVGPLIDSGGGDWDGWGLSEADEVVLACGPGQLLTADGSCASPPNPVVGVQVGCPLPSATAGWQDGEPIACRVGEDGCVHLPDGSSVHVDSLDLGELAHVNVGQSTTYGSGYGGDYVGPGASSSGSQTSSPAADAIEANWVAVLQAPAEIPGWTTANQTKLNSDHQNWEAFYAHIQNGESLYLLQDVSPWQTIVNEWGDAMRQMAPTVTAWPAGFPTTPGGAGLSTTPLALPSLPSLPDPTPWVIAVLVGVGLWVLWPVLAGAKGLLASL